MCAVCPDIHQYCLFPVPIRDPWLPVRGGVSCGGAAGSAQGSDGEPDNSTQPGTRGVKSTAAVSQHRGGLQSVGPKSGWAASEAGGDKRKIDCIRVPVEPQEENNRFPKKSIPNYEKLDDLSERVMLFVELRKTFWSLLQIVSHSRSRDGTWLNPDNLRQILTGLEACPAG